MKIRYSLLLSVAVCLASTVAIAEVRPSPSFLEEFTRLCPKPDWWDEVSSITPKNFEEIGLAWQMYGNSRPYFKAGYQAILDYPDDLELVMFAVNQIGRVDPTYPSNQKMRIVALSHYFGFKNKAWSSTASVVAGIVIDLNREFSRQGKYDGILRWSERLFRERGHELNDSMFHDVNVQYAEALVKLNQPDKAIVALQKGIEIHPNDARGKAMSLKTIEAIQRGLWHDRPDWMAAASVEAAKDK